MSAMRCPSCGCTDELVLIETHEELGTTDPGRIERDTSGHLIPPSVFWFEAGHSLHVEIQCDRCGHEWKPRQQLVSSEGPRS